MLSVKLYGDANGVKEAPKVTDYPTRLWMRNEGDVILYKANIDLDGESKENVQLAIDKEGEPGVWAAPGMGIIGIRRSVRPGESFSFWARAFIVPDETVDFSFKIELEGRQPN